MTHEKFLVRTRPQLDSVFFEIWLQASNTKTESLCFLENNWSGVRPTPIFLENWSGFASLADGVKVAKRLDFGVIKSATAGACFDARFNAYAMLGVIKSATAGG